jgi:molecular chaperone DnaK
VSSAKRLIGRYFFSEEVKKAQAICAYEIIEGPSHSVRIQIREEAFSLPEISAMVLREMKQVAEARLGHPITKAVITVPAYFNDNQRQATKDAGKIAGLEVLRILNEPTAAALAYGFGKGLNQRVAVYDLGGGTFDISVLEIGKDVFEVLATCGDTFLGGDDFDDRIIDLVAEEFLAREGVNLRDDLYAFEKLKMAAENAKKVLSVEGEVEINIPDIITGPDGQARSVQRSISQEEFASLVHDLVQRTFKVCDEAMQQSDLTVRDLDGVILVGGPTRLPVIRDAVSAYFQQELKAEVDPDEVVAMGAAIHAGSLVNADQDSYLLDVTPLDLRIGVAGGLAEPVIERNTPVPIEQTRRFTTFKDYQESVEIRIYQGGSRQAEENELLGQFEFSGFRKARRGEVEIDVTFEINADGIVEVTACDPETGEKASTSITLSSGLSDGDMQEILERDRTARVRSASPASESAGATRAELEPVPEDELPLPEAPPAAASPAPEAEAAPPPRPAAAAPAAPAEPIEELDTGGDEEDLETLDDLELGDLADQAEMDLDVVAEDRTDAVSIPDLDGDPEEQVPLGDSELQRRAEEAGAAPPAEASGEGEDAKSELFDTSNTNLSGDDDENRGS